MPWSPAASAASVKEKQARLAARVAAGKKHCPRHDNGVGAWLPLTEFNFSRGSPDGRFGWCRACTAADKRARHARDPAAAAANRARSARGHERRTAARMAASIDTAIKAAICIRTQGAALAAALAAIPTAYQGQVDAARIHAAVAVASDPRASRDDLNAALPIIPADQLHAIIAARVTATRARVEAEQARAEQLRLWRRGLSRPPEPFCEPGQLLGAPIGRR